MSNLDLISKKHTNNKIITFFIKIIGIFFVFICAVGYIAGIRINSTHSLAPGLYLTNNETLKVGSYVIFCPPKNEIFDEAKKRRYIGPGFCPGNYSKMMKQVAANAGDIISVADDGVRVNGKLLPFSVPLNNDPNGRPLKRFTANNYTLKNDELLLMTDVSAKSFDSRYFGPIKRSQIESVVYPVFTW